MIEAIGFSILGFVLMELSGWAIHKYLMHGPLWLIHKTHHEHSDSFFELNDLFSFLFGSIAVLLIFLGIGGLDYRFWIGIGISAYGMLYFFLHDILIHRRVKWLDRPRSGFLKGIFQAHQVHHQSNKRDGAVSFGLFLVPKKYFKNLEK
ncbi:sterol desaturase family protein [Algoriphagus persicinus]|uniref:sterol desaturase family protein n=1 Tax=Algoriphagus persicinus TaxID=3108754 RepID=UPI002B36F1A5|nr:MULTISPECIES: sterol desaturase family protein [unclassified Algoriphagus]MEB2779375.1 sterol desaturase family protein [Algoriphagus sp. C2-6-M1]MEB2783205.1 sterol desaturase family protein [Algoriphagus sp. E1-3-M2]